MVGNKADDIEYFNRRSLTYENSLGARFDWIPDSENGKAREKDSKLHFAQLGWWLNHVLFHKQ